MREAAARLASLNGLVHLRSDKIILCVVIVHKTSMEKASSRWTLYASVPIFFDPNSLTTLGGTGNQLRKVVLFVQGCFSGLIFKCSVFELGKQPFHTMCSISCL
jgi:hypothetical protein